MLISSNHTVSPLINHLNESDLPSAARKTTKNISVIFTLVGKFYGDRTQIKVRNDMDWTDRAINFVIRLSCYNSLTNSVNPCKKAKAEQPALCVQFRWGQIWQIFARVENEGSFAFLTRLYLFLPVRLVSKEDTSFFMERIFARLCALKMPFYNNSYFYFIFIFCIFISFLNTFLYIKVLLRAFNNPYRGLSWKFYPRSDEAFFWK